MKRAVKQCRTCYDNISAYDEIIILGDKVYHRRCVNLEPREVAVFSDGDFVGVTQEFDIEAYEILREGEYEEE